MRILLITDGIYPYVMGGMQKYAYYLGKFLSKAGVKVHLIHCAQDLAPGDEMTRSEFQGFDGRYITFESLPFPVTSKLPGHYITENKVYSKAVLDLVRCKLADFDLVYCQGFTAWAFIEAKEQGNLDIPVISNLHGYEMYQRPPSLKGWLGQWLLRSATKRVTLGSDAVVSYGGHINSILFGLGVPPESVVECPLGVEASWLVAAPSPTSDTRREFVFIGRDERRKGVHELTLALKALLKKNKADIKFHFIGPILEGHRLIDHRIIYHGAVQEEEKIKRILRGADVLVCPSYSEGMPTVIMEGMASGLAIIATDVGAVNRQVHGNGWLLPAPDVNVIRHALEKAIELPTDQLDALKRVSLERVRDNFTWERVISRKFKLLEGIAHRGE
ncbi:MAG: glycosyltransferase family 4 protein [Flavobacteriales bacterium]